MAKKVMRLRQKQAMATRQAIFRAGFSLISKKGYSNVKVEDICEMSGIAKGTFYKYFKSKDAIVLDTLLRVDERAIYLEANELSSIKNPADKLMTLFTRTLEYMESVGIDIIKVSYHWQIGPDRDVSAVVNDNRIMYTLTSKIIEQGQKEGIFRNDMSRQDLVTLVLRGVRGAIFDWCLTDGRIGLVAEGRKILSIIIEGISKQRTSNNKITK